MLTPGPEEGGCACRADGLGQKGSCPKGARPQVDVWVLGCNTLSLAAIRSCRGLTCREVAGSQGPGECCSTRLDRLGPDCPSGASSDRLGHTDLLGPALTPRATLLSQGRHCLFRPALPSQGQTDHSGAGTGRSGHTDHSGPALTPRPARIIQATLTTPGQYRLLGQRHGPLGSTLSLSLGHSRRQPCGHTRGWQSRPYRAGQRPAASPDNKTVCGQVQTRCETVIQCVVTPGQPGAAAQGQPSQECTG